MRIRKRLAASLAILLLPLAGPVAGQEEPSGPTCSVRPDREIVGESPLSSSSFEVGSAGDIDADGTVDLFVFEAPPEGALDECATTRARTRVHSGRTGQVLFEREMSGNCEDVPQTMASARDLDGDGIPELVMGAPGRLGSGKLAIVSTVLAAPLRIVAGDASGERFGASLAALGDVDGDGISDLAVGAPAARGPALQPEAGRVVVYSGKALASPEAELEVLFAFAGDRPGARFGDIVTGAGDFNGDEIPDLAVGASGANVSAPAYVAVFSGADGGLLARIGERAASLAFTGDLDGTPGDELLIGSPGGPGAGGGTPFGRVSIVRFANTGDPDSAAKTVANIDGPQDGSLFGLELASLGDVDRDGVTDFAVSAPRADFEERSGAGRVTVYSGRDRSVLAQLFGSGAGQFLGADLAGPVDLDGDGRGDLVATARSRGRGGVRIYLLGDSDGDGMRDACIPCGDSTPLAVDGAPATIGLCPIRPERCFRFASPAGAFLRAALRGNGAGTWTTMRLRFGAPPTAHEYDFESEAHGADLAEIVVPKAPSGEAFLSVRSRAGRRCLDSLELAIESSSGVIIRSITPAAVDDRIAGSQGGAQDLGDVRAAVSGAGFSAELEFAIVSEERELSISSQRVLTSDRAEISLTTGEGTAGRYDVVARRNGEIVARLPLALEVREARGQALRVALYGSPYYRRGDIGRLVLSYANSGESAIPAPLVRVRAVAAPQTKFWLVDPGRTPAEGSIDIVVLGPEAAPRVLPPRFHGEVTILFERNFGCDLCPLDFQALVFRPAPGGFIEWSSIENPSSLALSDDEWEAIRGPLSIEIGRTWREYADSLRTFAHRASLRGPKRSNALDLLNASFLDASGYPVAAIVGEVVNAEDGTPIPDVAVFASSEAGVAARTVADARGQFALAFLASGRTYDLFVAGHERAGGGDVSRTLTLPPRDSVDALARDVTGVVLEVASTGGPEDPGSISIPELPPLFEETLGPPDGSFALAGNWQTLTVFSRDPNKKEDEVSPGEVFFAGSTAAKSRPLLSYSVFFENSRCATAPARTVTIIDTLDERYFDISTLRIGAASVGGDDAAKVAVFDEDIWGRWELTGVVEDVETVLVDPERPLGEECESGELPDCDEAVEGAALGEAPRTIHIGDVFVDVSLTELSAEDGLWELVFEIESCPRQSCPGFLPPNDCATHQGEGWVSFSLFASEETEVENDVDVLFDGDERRALSHHVVTSLVPTGPPLAPVLPQPPDEGDGAEPVPVSTDEILTWEPILFATSCAISVFRLDDAGEVVEVLADEAPVDAPFWSPSEPFAPGTRYAWQVTVRNELGESTSELWTFRTAGAASSLPAIVTPLAPLDGAFVTGAEIPFSWSAAEGASSYSIWIWDAATEPVLPTAHLGSATSYIWASAEAGGEYAWQVVAANDAGETAGPVRQFISGAPAFLRGDVNADGNVNISDPIATLGHLFLGGTAPTCEDAADFDDSGALEITDAIAELQFLFGGTGGPLPGPGAVCDRDLTDDALGCESAPSCAVD